MFPFKKRQPSPESLLPPEYRHYLELRELLVEIKFSQSLVDQRLDRIRTEIADLREVLRSPIAENDFFDLVIPEPFDSRPFEDLERAWAEQDRPGRADRLRKLFPDWTNAEILAFEAEIEAGVAASLQMYEAWKSRQGDELYPQSGESASVQTETVRDSLVQITGSHWGVRVPGGEPDHAPKESELHA